MRNLFTNSTFLWVPVVTTLFFLFNSCEKDPQEIRVEGITLNKSELSLVVGNKQTISPTITPERASNKRVLWESSNPEIASVKDVGADVEVTAVKVGETTITVTTQDGNITATCKVTVTPQIIHVEKITVDKEEVFLNIDEDETIVATISPENATNKNISWISDHENIVTVDEKGIIKGIAAGEAIISVISEDGEKKATCKVTVGNRDEVAEIQLDVKELQLLPNDTKQIIATVLPESASNKNVMWTSSNESVATVDDSGLVTAVSIGEATITATTEEGGKTANCSVKVVSEIIEINLLDTEEEDYSFERITTNRSWPPHGTWGGSDAIGLGAFGANNTAIRVIPANTPEPRTPRTGVSYLFVRMRDNEPKASVEWFWRKLSNLTPGETYTFSFWYKTPSASELEQTGNIKLGAILDESDVATLRDALSPVITFGYEAPSSAGAKDSSSDVHKQVTYTFTMPTGKKDVYIGWVRNGQQQVFIDDMSLIKK